MPTLPERTCTTCGVAKPATTDYFGNQADRRGKTRLRAVCRECRARQERERYFARTGRTPPSERPGLRYCPRCETWKPDNADVFITDRGRTRAPCRSCAAKRDRASYQKHRKARMAKVNEWARANKAKVRVYQANNRAKRLEAEGSHTPADIAQLLDAQRDRCHWCHKPMGGKYEVDHRIPLVAGGTNDPSNIVLAHPECNRKKNRLLPWDFAEGRLL